MAGIDEMPHLMENINAIKRIFEIEPQSFHIAIGGGKGVHNEAGQNMNSLAILTYALYFDLTIAQTIPLFCEAYDEVLTHPDDVSHANIRALLESNSEYRIRDCVVIGKNSEPITETASVSWFASSEYGRRVDVEEYIEDAWEHRADIHPSNASVEIKVAINKVLYAIDSGVLRVADKLINGPWVIYQWIKKAILLSFRVFPNYLMSQPGEISIAYDKVDLKFLNWEQADFEKSGIRAVPGSVVRHGAYIAPNVILMPSFVNIGACIGKGTLVDTWATIGSCAQIGENCHISGGAGIGGVLEPVQAGPTIIGNNVFIGARSEIVEGVIVEDDCVISMGVFIGQSTKIFNRMTREISYGRVPAGSVVIAGSLPSADGTYSMNCAIIIKQVDAQTRSKTSFNELLRD